MQIGDRPLLISLSFQHDQLYAFIPSKDDIEDQGDSYSMWGTGFGMFPGMGFMPGMSPGMVPPAMGGIGYGTSGTGRGMMGGIGMGLGMGGMGMSVGMYS